MDVTPVWNLSYSPRYNAAVENYWAQLKSTFRPLLLKKMLAFPEPRSKDTPLKDALLESIMKTPLTSLPKYIKMGLDELERDALEVMKLKSDKDESEEEKDISSKAQRKTKSKRQP